MCVSYAAEEGDVVERRVGVDELEREQLDDEHVVVLRLCSMILYITTRQMSALSINASQPTGALQPGRSIDDQGPVIVNPDAISYATRSTTTVTDQSESSVGCLLM